MSAAGKEHKKFPVGEGKKDNSKATTSGLFQATSASLVVCRIDSALEDPILNASSWKIHLDP
jgi:hypothetical protein